MSSESPNTGVPDRSSTPDDQRAPDGMLAIFIKIMNRLGGQMGITISAGGSVITGKLIGAREYQTLVSQQISANANGNELVEALAKGMAPLEPQGDDALSGAAVLEGADYAFLHMKDARIPMGGVFAPVTGGFLLRARVETITAWGLGELAAERA